MTTLNDLPLVTMGDRRRFREAALKEVAELEQAHRDIYEVWAGSDSMFISTKNEKYMLHLIEDMRDIASKAVNNE